MNEGMNRKKFFGLLSTLPYGDLVQVQLAYWLAKNAHRPDPPRDDGTRQFEHARTVAVTLIQRGYQYRDLLTVALLHDVVEDTNTPSGIIVNLFEPAIWESLFLLSKLVPVFDPVTGQICGRYQKSLDEYFAGIAGARLDVRLVKCADRLDNLNTCGVWEPERQIRYAAESERYVLPIAEAVDPWFTREIADRIRAIRCA